MDMFKVVPVPLNDETTLQVCSSTYFHNSYIVNIHMDILLISNIYYYNHYVNI